MPRRGPLASSLLVVGTAVGGVLVLAGALALRGPALTAVAVAGLFAACLCAAIAREASSPGEGLRPALVASTQGAAWTVAVLLALAGMAGLAGGVITALVAGSAVMGGAAFWLVRAARAERRPAATAPRSAVADPVGRAAGLLRPVPVMSTRSLGQEWVRTSAVLAGRLDPAARAALVRRRQEALDELERRDPEGFARWLLGGPVQGSDPADYVRPHPIAGTDAA